MKSKYNRCSHDCDCCKPVKSVPCVHTNTDCTFVTEDLDCIESKKGTMLTKVLSRIDEAICELRSKVAGATSYIFQNVGAGAEVFKKVSGGIVDYRTIISTDTSVKITEEEDEIDLETKPIQSDSDYIHVGRVGGVDRINFSGVGEVISSDNSVNITVVEPNTLDFTGVQSNPGEQGPQGEPGVTPHIGTNGNWFIGEVDTGVLAEGVNGVNGYTPTIDEGSGNWFINGVDTGFSAVGEDGLTPTVGHNGNWFIDGEDTGQPTTGPAGNDGDTPIINEDGNWEIGGVDTGIPATGPQGDPATIEVTSLDNTVTVDTQMGGAIVDLSVNIPQSMVIEEAECKQGVPTISVDEESQVATALCLVSDTVTITREGDSIRLESEEQGVTYTGSETIEIDSNNEIIRKALTGDVEAPYNSNVTTIKDNAVTYAKIQKVSANKLLGRQSGIPTTGNVQEISIGSNLTLSQAGVLSADVKYEADIRKVGVATDLTYGHNGTTLVLVNSGTLIFTSDLNTLLDPFEVFVVNDTAGPKDIALTATSGWTYRANAEDVTGTVTLDKGGTCVIMRRASDDVVLILGDVTI